MKDKSTMDKKPITVISAPKKKTKSEKISMIVVFTVGSILLAAILYLYGIFSFIGVRIFDGNRISGEIAILANEKEIKPISASAEFNNISESTMTLEEISGTLLEDIEFNDSEDTSTTEIGLSSFSTLGGEEGVYTLDFVVDKDELYALTGAACVLEMKDDLHIKFNYNNEKWYFITSIRLKVLITGDENGLLFDIDADYFADNAERYKVTENFNKSIYLSELSKNNEIVVNLWD